MRNKFPGTCYVCNKPVGKGEGHFERFKGGWRVQCWTHPVVKRKSREAQSP